MYMYVFTACTAQSALHLPAWELQSSVQLLKIPILYNKYIFLNVRMKCSFVNQVLVQIFHPADYSRLLILVYCLQNCTAQLVETCKNRKWKYSRQDKKEQDPQGDSDKLGKTEHSEQSGRKMNRVADYSMFFNKGLPWPHVSSTAFSILASDKSDYEGK